MRLDFSAQRDGAAIGKSLALCTPYFRFLDQALSNQPFLAGDSLTLVDIPAGTTPYRHFELGIDRPSLPDVEAWYERLQLRSAYQEHVMIPFDALRARLDY